ncbi:hypothetical protein B5M09_001618 [Aphanomyces astaci]|uniref:RING-type domain-containing protein n=2 Tax=Aphanomyces astaci TaxID=112090 RepID=A0A425D4U2_APHAT|nr:hypothetical protein B5M09_001618 [Aphanomyces astaci]
MTTENLLRMLECAICKDYLATATQTSCCGTVFCKRCIRTWVRAKGTCPVCRKSHSLENLVPAHYVQRIANEMRADLCPPDEDVDMATTDVATPPFPNGAQAAHVHPPNDPILPNQNGVRQLDIRSGPNGSFIFTCPFTIGVVCTAVRNRNAVDHSVRMTIKSADNVVAAHVELLPHSNQYLAMDHWNQDLAAISYAATNPIVAVPLPEWRGLDGPNDMIMRAYEPQSRRDTIWTQVRRPDTARVFSMVAKSDPFWNFSRSRNWHVTAEGTPALSEPTVSCKIIMPSVKAEVGVAIALGVGLGYVWKSYADGELKTIDTFYQDLKKKAARNNE